MMASEEKPKHITINHTVKINKCSCDGLC